jgi:uncharacterized protein (DUF1778 family)
MSRQSASLASHATPSPASPARGRITARVPQRVLEKLELAASISGATLNQFITQASLEKAEKVVENERLWRLSDETMKWLLELLDNPPAPTPQLIEAMNWRPCHHRGRFSR